MSQIQPSWFVRVAWVASSCPIEKCPSPPVIYVQKCNETHITYLAHVTVLWDPKFDVFHRGPQLFEIFPERKQKSQIGP